MPVALKISDQTSSGEVLTETILQFPADRITVKQLIEVRVEDEVTKFNDSPMQKFRGLIQPKESEQILNGFRMRKAKPVNVEIQKGVAVEAFKSCGFFLLVNDRQVTEPDEELIITPNTSVVFMKLIPLVGG